MEFSRKNLDKSKDAPLRDLIPSYSTHVKYQIDLLDTSLGAFRHETETSLDVILMKSLNNLRSVLVDYKRLLEEILVVKMILKAEQARRRNLRDLVNMMHTALNFQGGAKAVDAEKFLKEMQNRYLSSVEEKVYVEWIRAVRVESLKLKSFIEDN